MERRELFVRFVLENHDGTPMIDWPDCGWAQAWRLIHLFERMPANGSRMFLYFS
jgi:hypothetical protein